MDERHKTQRNARPEPNLLDKGQRALQELVQAKSAERASGRFGVVIVLDRGKHAGIRMVIDEAHYVS